MNKLLLKLDYSDYLKDDMKDYLLSLDGVSDASINISDGEVYVEYDGIDLKVLKLEILNYLKLIKTPSIEGFNKLINNGKEYIIHVADLCCEYCLRNMIEDLLDTDGVISASHNYDYKEQKVDITITYDDSIIDDNKLKELDEHFNHYG